MVLQDCEGCSRILVIVFELELVAETVGEGSELECRLSLLLMKTSQEEFGIFEIYANIALEISWPLL